MEEADKMSGVFHPEGRMLPGGCIGAENAGEIVFFESEAV